jgi:hypothetical protein
MDDLLKLAIEAYGGLERWRQFNVARANASITGALWHLKGQPDVLKMFRWLLNSIANTWSLTSSGKIGEHYSPLARSQLNQNQSLSKKPV